MDNNRADIELARAVGNNDAAAVKQAIAHGADVNKRYMRGTSILLLACEDEHWDAAIELLKSGANPNVVNICRRNAINSIQNSLIKLLKNIAEQKNDRK